jgi:hypothetical protein
MGTGESHGCPRNSPEDGTNKRTDAYGGATQNRARFLSDIVDELSLAIGAIAPESVSLPLVNTAAYATATHGSPLIL